MRFMDAYKHLERLCSDITGERHGVSAYIDAMVNNPSGRFLVSGWDEDLKHLKHYRYIRNKIVHEVGCAEENSCSPEDTAWLNNFYGRIINQTDPLALYRKAMQQRLTTPRKVAPATQKSKKTTQEVIEIDDLWIAAAIVIGIAIVLLLIFG